jgi:hypothetical protein
MARLQWVPRRKLKYVNLSEEPPKEIVLSEWTGDLVFVQSKDEDKQKPLNHISVPQEHFKESTVFVGRDNLPEQPENTIVVKSYDVRCDIDLNAKNKHINIPGEGNIEVSFGTPHTRAWEGATIKYKIETHVPKY